MNEQEKFFIAESVRHARTLPHAECLRFLQGMLLSIGEHDGVVDLRRVVMALRDVDAQLELISGGQLKLELAA